MNDDNLCTPEETAVRVAICIACVNFAVRDNFTTYCTLTKKDVSLLSANKDQTCPLENW